MSILSFEEFLTKSGVKKSKFLEALDMDYKTWQKRREEPLRLTAGEIKVLSEVLNCKPTYILQIIFSDPNA